MDQSGAQYSENVNREVPRSGAEQLEEGAALSAGQYLDKALNLIGKKMRAAASVVKERAPKEGTARSALESASNVLDAAGRYMSQDHVADQVGGVIRRYPLRSLGVCFLFGFVAGSAARALRR